MFSFTPGLQYRERERHGNSYNPAIPERIPSEKQSIYLVNLLKRLELEGLKED